MSDETLERIRSRGTVSLGTLERISLQPECGQDGGVLVEKRREPWLLDAISDVVNELLAGCGDVPHMAPGFILGTTVVGIHPSVRTASAVVVRRAPEGLVRHQRKALGGATVSTLTRYWLIGAAIGLPLAAVCWFILDSKGVALFVAWVPIIIATFLAFDKQDPRLK